MPSAAGTLGRPGMVIILPASATVKPAPALTFICRTVTVKFSGAPSFFASSEKLLCVLAMHTGNLSKPSAGTAYAGFRFRCQNILSWQIIRIAPFIFMAIKIQIPIFFIWHRLP